MTTTEAREQKTTTVITSITTDEEKKIVAFGEILQKLEQDNQTSIVPILKKIEANTSVLKTRDTTKTGVKTVVAEGRFPRTTLVAGRETAKSRSSKPTMPIVTANKAETNKANTCAQEAEKGATAQAAPPVLPVITVDASISARTRDEKGRFIGKTPVQDIIPDESGKIERKSLLQILKRGFDAIDKGRSRGLLSADTMKEAAGRAIGGPFFDAAMEIKDVVDSVKDNPPDAKKAGNDKIIKALMKSDMSDEKRHKELVKAILEGNKGDGENGDGGGGVDVDVDIPFPKKLRAPRLGSLLRAIPFGTVASLIPPILAAMGLAAFSKYNDRPEVQDENRKRQEQAKNVDANKGKPSDAFEGTKVPVNEGVAQFVGRQEASGKYGAVNLKDVGNTVDAGLYQFSSVGELPNFLRARGKDAKTNAERFGITADPAKDRLTFQKQWKAAASGNLKDEFAKAQDEHFETAVVKPAMTKAQAHGVDVSDIGTQKVLASMATTTSPVGNTRILKEAVEAGGGYNAFKGLSAEKQRRLIVTERKKYVQGLPRMSLEEKAAAMKRYDRELAEVTDAPSTTTAQSADSASIVTANAPMLLAEQSLDNFGISKTATGVAKPWSAGIPSPVQPLPQIARVESEQPAQEVVPTPQALVKSAKKTKKKQPIIQDALPAAVVAHKTEEPPSTGQKPMATPSDAEAYVPPPVITAAGSKNLLQRANEMATSTRTAIADVIDPVTALTTNVRGLGTRAVGATGITDLVGATKRFIPESSVATTIARGAPARLLSVPERMTSTVRTATESQVKQAQGIMQGGTDMSSALMAAIEKLNKNITKMSGSDETKQPSGVPVIKTEFDDTMLTLMAYDRI